MLLFLALMAPLSLAYINNEIFHLEGTENWLEAVLDPTPRLGIIPSDVHSFQLYTVVLLDCV